MRLLDIHLMQILIRTGKIIPRNLCVHISIRLCRFYIKNFIRRICVECTHASVTCHVHQIALSVYLSIYLAVCLSVLSVYLTVCPWFLQCLFLPILLFVWSFVWFNCLFSASEHFSILFLKNLFIFLSLRLFLFFLNWLHHFSTMFCEALLGYAVSHESVRSIICSKTYLLNFHLFENISFETFIYSKT